MDTSFTKTGTTIVGLIYKSGIILASDTRATSGPIVVDKNIHKLHTITHNIYACGAGVAADTDRVALHASKKLKLFERKFNRMPRVSHCVRFMRNHLHAHNAQIGSAFILGGVDEKGKHLYGITPHGYHTWTPFMSLGSGSLAATGVLEMGYKSDMEREDAIKLAVDAIRAGILNDLYSGSNVDLCIIMEDEENVCKVEIIREYEVVAKRCDDKKIDFYPLNSIKILSEEIIEINDEI